MAKVYINRDGLSVEANLSVEELKQLLGLSPHQVGEFPAIAAPHTPTVTQLELVRPADFASFYARVTDRAKKFLDALAKYPQGIDADALAQAVGFSNPNQIGGLIGRGIRGYADEHKLPMEDIYRTDVSFPGGKRIRMFYPGRLLLEQIRKPA